LTPVLLSATVNPVKAGVKKDKTPEALVTNPCVFEPAVVGRVKVMPPPVAGGLSVNVPALVLFRLIAIN
jgi:hypothetical protein